MFFYQERNKEKEQLRGCDVPSLVHEVSKVPAGLSRVRLGVGGTINVIMWRKYVA